MKQILIVALIVSIATASYCQDGTTTKKTPRYRKVESNYGKKRFLLFKEDQESDNRGLMNSSGLVIVEPSNLYVNVDMMNQVGIASIGRDKNYSIIDSTGQVLLSGLTDVANFFEGRAAVKQNGKWGYIDGKAQMVIPPQFEDFVHFSNGMVTVAKRDAATQAIFYGVIDKSGKPVIDFKYDKVTHFLGDFCCFKEHDTKKWGIMDKTGKVVLPATYDSLDTEQNDHFLAGKGGKFGLISKTGKVIVPIKYDEIDYWMSEDFILRVTIGGKVGLINTKTGMPIGRFYDQMSRFNSGLAVVELNKKKGYMNKAGVLVIPLIYDDAKPFFDSGDVSKTRVTINGKTIMIDTKGRKVKEEVIIDDVD